VFDTRDEYDVYTLCNRREERNEFSVYTQLGSEDDAGLDPLGMNSVS
jgi:hypothetical protein